MGIETAALLGGGLMAGQLLGGITQGRAQNKAAQAQADLIEQETKIQAERKEQEVESFRKKQEMAFLKSGVILEGSPLMVLHETERKGLEDVQNIKSTGSKKAAAVRQSGRQAFQQGVFGGAMSAGQTAFNVFE